MAAFSQSASTPLALSHYEYFLWAVLVLFCVMWLKLGGGDDECLDLAEYFYLLA